MNGVLYLKENIHENNKKEKKSKVFYEWIRFAQQNLTTKVTIAENGQFIY